MPVIGYSIQAALASRVFDEVMVSTDSEEIAQVARSLGAKVPFMRSAETANDFATTADVIREVLDCYGAMGRRFDDFCCIYATAPFILPYRLREGMRKVASGQHAAAFTCVEFSYPVQRGLEIHPDGRIAMRWPEFASARSQDLPKTYHDAGQFYCCSVPAFLREGTLWGSDTVPIILPEMEVQDLDTMMDWQLAEQKFRALAFPERLSVAGYELVNYNSCTPGMHRQILAERNAPETRALMVNRDPISEESHFRFLDSIRHRPDKAYYAIIESEGEMRMVGTVNFEKVADGELERGLIVFSEFRGHGLAGRFMPAIYRAIGDAMHCDTISTTVRVENAPSLALEKKLGAQCVCEAGGFRYFTLKIK